MWFTESVAFLIFLTIFTFFAGLPLHFLLSQHNRFLSLEGFCLSLFYGTFTISYLFLIGSYCNLPGKYIGPVIILLVTTWTLLLRFKLQFKIKTKTIFQILLVYVLVIFIALLPLFLYKSISPYNDTIGYIGISDYLYNHGFLKKYVATNGFHPFDFMILMIQPTRARVGGTFFFTAIQSMLEIKKSLFVFPVAQTWGLILNLASITISSRWILHLRWNNIFIILLVSAITFNPLYYSIHNAFNHQLYGMAFFLLVLASFSRLIQKSNSKDVKRFLLINAVFLSSLILFYPELFPFAFLALFCGMFVPFLRYKTNKKHWFLMLCSFALLTIVISNIGFIGLLRFLPHQIKVSGAGWNIPYSSFEFFSTAVGILPIEPSNLLSNFLAVAFLILFLFGMYKLIKNKFLLYCTFLSTLVIFFGFFLYYRFFVVNPWFPNITGQSWNMFKLVSWIYPCVIMGVGYGVSQLRWQKLLTVLILIACIPVSIKSHPFHLKFVKASNQVASFEAYKTFADAANHLKTNLPIELVTESRMIIAYYLSPRLVVSDWRNVCYLGRLNTEYKNMQVKEPHYIIIDSQYALKEGIPLPANTMLIHSNTPHVKYFKNFYDLESVNGLSWRWSKGNAYIAIQNHKVQDIKLKFNIRSLTFPAELLLQASNNKSQKFIINNQDWHPIEFVLHLKSGETLIGLQTNVQPIKVGQDPRLLSFAVSDLKVVSE